MVYSSLSGSVLVPLVLPLFLYLFLCLCFLVVVLPHVGSAEETPRTDMATLAASNILAGLSGEKLPAQAA